MHALVRRIGALEQRLTDAGLEVPAVAEQAATPASADQRRASMRDSEAATSIRSSVVTAAALVAAATGHGRGALPPAVLRESVSPAPPHHQQRQHSIGTTGATPLATPGASGMWSLPPLPPPPLPTLPQVLAQSLELRDGSAIHSGSSLDGTDGADNHSNGAGGGGGGGSGMRVGDVVLAGSPASSAAASSSSAASAASTVYPGEAERRRRLRAGSMSQGRPGGHSRYIGITANYHIYSNLYHAEKEEVRRERETNAARTRSLLASIPYEAHQHLIDHFWTCYNTIIHIIHRRAFELDSGGLVERNRSGFAAWENGLNGASGTSGTNSNSAAGGGASTNPPYGRRGYYSLFLHVCMLAVGYRYADRTRPDIQAFATHEGGSLMHDEAKRLVDYELKMPGGIASLQALLLLGDLECGVGRYNTGWLYAGMASRLAFDLGLNRLCGEVGQPKLDRDVKRTALWGCVILDRSVLCSFSLSFFPSVLPPR